MTKYLAAYVATAFVTVVVDLVWLGFIAKPFYQQGIGHVMASAPRLVPALLFYLIFPQGLVVFAVLPHVDVGSWRDVLRMGVLFGFFAYATYDLTNLARLKAWPISLSIVDMAWGSTVSGAASVSGFFAAKRAIHSYPI